MEKNILLPLVCCVVETCWELPGPLCSAVLLSKGGSCPSPGCVLGIAERFCCSADYKVPESHSALLSGVSFPEGQQMLPPSSSSIRIQGFGGHRELEPPVLCPQLPGIVLAMAFPAPRNPASHCSSPAVGKCDHEQIIPPQCLSFPCSVGTLTPVPVGWEDEKCPWSTDINTFSGVIPSAS